MTEDRKLSKIALKEAVKFIKLEIKSGAEYSSKDVIEVARNFYQFLKQN